MHEPSEDERLITATLGGDDEAFARIVGRHKRQVFRIASRFAHDRNELEDICQDVFIKAYEKLKTFRHDAPFEHWLARITVRTCYDALRRRRLHNVHTSTDSLPFEMRDHAEETRQAAQRAHELLSRGLEKLRPEERLVITLLELEERSVREVAALTGWSEANVKVRAYRARKALRKSLEEVYER